MIDLAKLFAPYKRVARFRDREAELDSVRARQKAMSIFTFTRAAIDSDDADYERLLVQAFDRQLTVVLVRAEYPDEPTSDRVNVFVLYVDQAWRISTYQSMLKAVRETGGRWSHSLETLQSNLLGYSEQERATWTAENRREQAGWGTRTIYALLTPRQKADVLAHGKKCLGTAAVMTGMTTFVHVRGDLLRSTAPTLVGKGITIARTAVTWDFSRTLFGSAVTARALATEKLKPPSVLVAKLAKRQASAINAALEANVEFLTAEGWS